MDDKLYFNDLVIINKIKTKILKICAIIVKWSGRFWFMKKIELIKLKRLLNQEKDRRNRINELLSNDLILEFLSLNNLNINRLQSDDNWLILEEVLKEFEITESNGILVCTGSYLTGENSCY